MPDLDIISKIAELGFLAVCGGVMILLFWAMTKKQQKYIDEDRKNNQKMMQDLVRAISRPYTAEMDKTCEYISSRIYELVDKLRKETSASRAMYVAYHNGTRDLDGAHFDQMSCRVESVTEGVKSTQLAFQRIPRGFLLNWCNKIRENKNQVISIPDIEGIRSDDYSFYEFLHDKDVKAVYGKAILDAEDHVRGFLEIEYTYNPEKVDFDEVNGILITKATKIAEQLLILDKEQKDAQHKTLEEDLFKVRD